MISSLTACVIHILQQRCLTALFAMVMLLSCFITNAVSAESSAKDAWKYSLYEHAGLPGFFLTVDKEEQSVKIFERNNPVRLISELQCTTGRAPGDKFQKDDLKTPEGIYFIEKHISSGLDYLKYGNEAYTLNYPNPIDRMNRKTGYGIWIHGKGVPLEPRLTEGCVALNNDELRALGNKLTRGMPVALAADVVLNKSIPKDKVTDVAVLEANVRNWSKAWADMSNTLFDFYNGDLYSLSTESFAAFKAQKIRLFGILDWVKIDISGIQILEGPNYWVTWFYQDYKASNLSSSGTRRLYWQKNNSGKFLIVGMEWLPDFKSPIYYADASQELQTNKPNVELASAQQVQNNAENKITNTVQQAKPVTTPKPQIEAKPVVATKPQIQAPMPVAKSSPASGEQKVVNSAPSKPVVNGHVLLAENLINSIKVEATLVEQKQPVAGNLNRQATPLSVAEKPVRVKADAIKPVQVLDTPKIPQVVNVSDNLASSSKPNTSQVDNSFRSYEPEGLELVEGWRRAWQNGDVNTYISYYAPSASQGSRSGAKQIKNQKESLWQRAKPATVSFSNIKINKTETGLLLMMDQAYSDNSGYSDKGIKVLNLESINGKLKIVREDWVSAN